MPPELALTKLEALKFWRFVKDFNFAVILNEKVTGK